jgi:ATP-dependent Lon protease
MCKEKKMAKKDKLETHHLDIQEVLPVLPLRNTLLFPGQIIPLSIGRKRSMRVIEDTLRINKMLAVVAQKEVYVDNPQPEDLYQWGTVAQVIKVFQMPNETQSVMVQGICRMKILEAVQTEPYIKVHIKPYMEEIIANAETEALIINLRQLFERVAELAPYVTTDMVDLINQTENGGQLADFIANILNVSIVEKQMVLEITEVKKRLEQVIGLINKEIQILEIGSKIQSDVQGEINKTQREYYLREQLKAIRKELGEEDERTTELNELAKRIEVASLSEEARKVVKQEMDRLARMPPAAPEHTIVRSYLDWLIDLPWEKGTEDNLDVLTAQKILDEDHYDLVKVKKRIVEYLAVRQLKQDMKGPILCFVGPPGVGKTSLGKSIARAMGRKFIRISLGGIRDEAEIRGHRRTYIGALPGRIIQSMKRAGSNNPVFMLDEIDKVGADFRGDPSSALLEVLDPEQNHSFSDHYLEVPFNLSHVMFIATANVADPILPALRDRMEFIELPGYIDEDKLQIARNFLIPKQLHEHGLTPELLQITDDAVLYTVNAYTREAGVRNLERQIATICRGVARDIVAKQVSKEVVDKEKLDDYLGPEKFFPEVAERTSRFGVVTGLAWTPSGGDILFIEATKMRGRGKLTLTGYLGGIMKESAQAALSYIRSMARELNIDEKIFEKFDLHIHVPAGAIPKDGPSAGVAIYTALVSLLTERQVQYDLAMTGEITLRGMILPVGGIKEKVLAAKRAGIHTIILPNMNKKDLEEIPEAVRKTLNFHFVREMKEVTEIALNHH